MGAHRPWLPLLVFALSGLVVALLVRQPRPFFSIGVLLACLVSWPFVGPGDSLGLEVIAGLLGSACAFGGELLGTVANQLRGQALCN